MIFEQADLASNWNQGVAIGVLSFIGGCWLWYLKRTYGKEGTETRRTESSIECEKLNSATLIELKDLAASQQRQCGRHALSMETVETELDSVDGKLDAVIESSKSIADEWADVNHKEFRTPPILDAIVRVIKTVEALEKKGWRDCEGELRELRGEIEEIKARMKAR